MAELPTGTVTFLFTDIQGSTRLLKQLGQRYGELLADHQRILRAAFARHNGREIDTQGDSFFAAFARAGDAVACAIEAQRILADNEWPEGVAVKVRMGLHSGEPRATGERYVGLGVHRAARVGAVGHGGQILVSNATRELVEDDLPPDTSLRDLGAYRLKDVERAERLFQVVAPRLSGNFPAPTAPRVEGPRRRVRRLLMAGAVLALIGLAAAIGYVVLSDEATAVGSAERPIRIAFGGSTEEPDYEALVEVLKTFEGSTDYAVSIEPLDSANLFATMEQVLREQLAGDDPPTLAFVPPGIIGALAGDGLAKPLSSLGLAADELRQSYGDAWIDLGTFRDEPYGFPLATNSKSLLWYRPDEFARLGVSPPKTWGEVVSLTKRIARAGGAPWSLSAADSWTLTDWFENLYIRTSGPWKYDALFAGKLPFDDPSVLAALKVMTTLFTNDHVAGGIAGALRTDFGDSVHGVFGPEPRAQLLMEGGFVGPTALASITPRPRPGKTIASTPFPAINASVGNSVVVGAGYLVPFDDGAAVHALLRYLSSPGAGRILVSSGAIASPHRGVPLSAYPDMLVRTEARQITEAEHVRLDGSDLLPGSLGAELGATLQRVLARPSEAGDLMEAFQVKAARAFKS